MNPGDASRSLGLARGAVELRAYDPVWPEEFDAEAARLRAALGGLAAHLEHVGSTAVPGLPAKPIVDLALGFVDEAARAELAARLPALGYSAYGDRRGDGDWFFAKGSEAARTHYLHAERYDSERWRKYLRLRDRLRADRSLRDEYAQLKAGLATQFPRDREAYTRGKEAFIRRLLAAD
jgi:GrpB-like predicted nucleotidyltransferase (UPF0157 family)